MKTAHTATLASLLPEWAHTPILSIQFAKEMRVLTPISICGAVAIVLSAMLSEGLRMIVVMITYAVTCAAIGAMSFGHDYQIGRAHV